MGKEYELVGGQPVKITPLEVEDAGTYYAPHGQAFNPVIAKSGGGGGGYTVKEELVTIAAEQMVTTQAQGGGNMGVIMGDFSGVSDGTQCVVVFNSTQYELSATGNNGVIYIGTYPPTFTDYPFLIMIQAEGASEGAILVSSQASPTISVAALLRVVEVTDDFSAAVEKAVVENDSVLPFTVALSWDDSINDGEGGYVADKPLDDAIAAFKAKRPVVVISDDPLYAPAIAFSRNTYPNIASLSWIYQTIGYGTGHEFDLEEYSWTSDGIEITARYYAPLTER